jgi:glycosyltransferase involved in cell wall biosynthesis
VSAIVTTHNAAAALDACLRSLEWCDEILVVDSHSSDDTVAVARRHARVRVLQRRYLGAASQKNWAIDRVHHDWVLILDADERVTPDLRREIEERLAAPDPPSSFSIPRRTFSLGREVRYSGWQHDRVVRLFRRDAARYPNRRVHADMMTLEPPALLEGALEHYMVDDLAEYAGRLQRYAVWGAAQLWRDGGRAGAWEIAVRPAWRFLRTYLLQGGVLEGVHGLVMCALQAYAAFLKYATLWSWGVDEARGRLPELPEFDDDPATWSWPAATGEGARPMVG